MEIQKLVTKIELPSPPIYNRTETVIQYTRRFNEYIDNVTKIKYNIILQFLNLWLNHYNIKLNRLIEFKNIPKSKIIIDKKHNKKILKQYSDELYKYFNIDKLSFENVASDDIEEEDIIVFLKQLLNKIDYYLFKKEKDSDIFYSIVHKTSRD